MSKSPSSRRGRYRFNDDHRVPFPEHSATTAYKARYLVTPLGRVYRDDGFLLRPHARTLKIKLNGGSVCKSLPMAIYRAFGRVKFGDPTAHHWARLWVPWVSPDAPIDEATGRRTCSTKTVRLARLSDLKRLGHGSITPSQVQTVRIR